MNIIKREPFIVKLVNDFHKELKSVEDDPEKVLYKLYVFYKTYQYEPDVTNGLPYTENKTILPNDLYKKLTGHELSHPGPKPIRLLWWVTYHCEDFIDLYESKFNVNVKIEHKNEPNRVYIVMGSIGEYSLNEEQAIAVFKSKKEAIAFVDKLNDKPTSYYDVHFSGYKIGDESKILFYIKSAEFYN